MGGHWVSVLTLSGMLNLPILIESYAKRGKELCATEQLLSKIPPVLGKQRTNTVSLGLFELCYKDIQKDSKSAKCPPCNKK